jgi:hypothetical protein
MHRRVICGLAVVALAFAGTGVAVAKLTGSGPPRTDPVVATYDADLVAADETFCQGQDGFYRDSFDTFKGVIVSPDPRLTGPLINHAHSILNVTTGWGLEHNHLIVRDPVTGKKKVDWRARTIISPGGVVNGVVFGTVQANGGLPAGVIQGNARGTIDFVSRKVSFEIGSGNTGAKNGENTAAIQSSSCKGADDEDDGDD